MDKGAVRGFITDYAEKSELNRIPEEDAIYPELAGVRIFDAPLVGFSSAADSLYTETFKKEGVVSPEYLAPAEWLPGAETVISFFLPFSEEIRRSNRTGEDIPYEAALPQRASAAWLHGRIEGQEFINSLGTALERWLKDAGCDSLCPTVSDRFRKISPYVSNWSERHAAYASGLGTFGLSKGLITEKGMAGRFGSELTGLSGKDLDLFYANDFIITSHLIAAEIAGYLPYGEGWKYICEGRTAWDGDRPINSNGGRTAFGHAHAASGLADVYECCKQIWGECEGHQVKGSPETAMLRGYGGAQNVAAIVVRKLEEQGE